MFKSQDIVQSLLIALMLVGASCSKSSVEEQLYDSQQTDEKGITPTTDHSAASPWNVDSQDDLGVETHIKKKEVDILVKEISDGDEESDQGGDSQGGN